MISINELRVGNYFYVNLKDEKVLEIRNDGVIYDSYYTTDNVHDGVQREMYKAKLIPVMAPFEDMEPITLTPKMLEYKCGFYYDEEVGLFKVKNTDAVIRELISIKYNFYRDEFCLSDNFTMNSMPFRYLHQLQNIFFFIAGKELEINL